MEIAVIGSDEFTLGFRLAGVRLVYVAGKEKEWEEYCTRVSSWELAKYMVLY